MFRVGQILFNVACAFAAHHGKSFVPASFFFFKVSIDHLFDNLQAGKRNYCFGKKARILDPRNRTNPVLRQLLTSLYFVHPSRRDYDDIFGKGLSELKTRTETPIAPCEGIQTGLGFWIPGTGSGFLAVERSWIPESGFPLNGATPSSMYI